MSTQPTATTYFDANGNMYANPALDNPWMTFGDQAYQTGTVYYSPPRAEDQPSENQTVVAQEGSAYTEHGSDQGYISGTETMGFQTPSPFQGHYGDWDGYNSPPPQGFPGYEMGLFRETYDQQPVAPMQAMAYAPPMTYPTPPYTQEAPVYNYYAMPPYTPQPPMYTYMPPPPQFHAPARRIGGYHHQHHLINVDIDQLRHNNNLFTFIHLIANDPRTAGLRPDAITGRALDIVEDHSDHTLLKSVPKKLLLLFLGRQTVYRFLRTLETAPEDVYEKQELRVPAGSTSHVGLKILLAWMRRAVTFRDVGDLKEMAIPDSLFSAIALARTLLLFGLRIDADRVDRVMASHHFSRTLSLDTVMSIWNCVPKDSKYTWRMVEVLKVQLNTALANNSVDENHDIDAMLEFFNEQPALRARIWRDGENDKFRPVPHAEWVKRGEDQRCLEKEMVDKMKQKASEAENNKRDSRVEHEMAETFSDMKIEEASSEEDVDESVDGDEVAEA